MIWKSTRRPPSATREYRSGPRLRWSSLGGALALLGTLLPVAAAPSFQTIALSGQQAPGLASGLTFESFSLPMANDSGAVAFACSLAGTADDETIWTLLNGTLQLAAQVGAKAPNTPGSANEYLYGPGLLPTGFDSAGNVAFTADLTDTIAEPTQGLWRGKAGSVSAVALEGAAVPGFGNGFTYSTITSDGPVVQVGGVTAFAAAVSDGTTDADGLWKGSPGAVTLVASTVSAPPGVSGANFSIFAAPALNSLGKIAFTANLALGNGGVTAANDQGIWSDAQGSLSLVVRKAATAPGAAGTKFDFFGNPQLLVGNRVVFSAQLLIGTGGVDDTNDTGIWRDSSTGLKLVARTGDQAPGAPAGAVFELLDGPLVTGGAVAFTAQLRVGSGGVVEENQDGIWLSPSGTTTVSLLVREGDSVPGLFGLTLGPDRGTLMLNGLGHVAFSATLSGTGVVTGTNDEALFAQDAQGALNLVLRSGDSFQLSPGNFRTVDTFALSTLGAGLTTADSWNDLHQLAFGITFTDGSSGLFLANVPEPTVALLAGTGLFFLTTGRRRRAR